MKTMHHYAVDENMSKAEIENIVITGGVANSKNLMAYVDS